MARKDSVGRRPTIGLLVSWTGHTQANEIWSSVRKTAREQGINLVCFNVGNISHPELIDTDQRRVISELVHSTSVDGLVTFLWWRSQEWFEQICARYRSLPIVNVIRLYEGRPGVAWDNHQLTHDLVSHLIEVHGYQRIAFIGLEDTNLVSQVRHRAYSQALTEHGLEPDPNLVPPGDYGEGGDGGIRCLFDDRQLLPGDDVEAIVAYNDDTALAALEALQERGIRVPYDVAVVGIDDIQASATAVPSLTTMAMPRADIASRATGMLLTVLDGGEVPEQVTLPASLVVRQSCGCLDPAVVLASAVQEMDAPAVGGDADQVLSERQDEMVGLVAREAGLNSFEDEAEVGRLWAAFLDALAKEVDSTASFLPELDGILRRAGDAGRGIEAWHHVLSGMRRLVLPYLSSEPELSQRAENLWQQGRVFLSGMVQQLGARGRSRAAEREVLIRQTATELLNVFDLDSLSDVVTHMLPQLGIPGCYISLYEDPERPSDLARLAVAFDQRGRIELVDGGQVFAAQELVPEGLLDQDAPYSLVVYGLFFGDTQLGFVVYQAGLDEGQVYQELSTQISSALWSVRLLEEQQRAERSLAEERAILRQRNAQLQIAADVSRAANTVLDLNELLQRTVDLIRDGFDLYYVGLFLSDEDGEWARLRAGTGDAGAQMVERGHRLQVGGDSMIGQCVLAGEARVALDVGEAAQRFENPLLPDTRSEMALPLVSRGLTVGAITVQSREEAAFSDQDIVVLQSMAEQLGTTIDNVRLLGETRSRVERERRVRMISDRIRRGMSREAIIRIALEDLGEMLGASQSVVHLGTGKQLLAEHPGAEQE